MAKLIFPKDFKFIPPPEDWAHNRLTEIDKSDEMLWDIAEQLVETQGEIEEILVKHTLEKLTIGYLFDDFVKLTQTDEFINADEVHDREQLVDSWLKFHLCNPLYDNSMGIYKFMKDNHTYFL